LCGPRFSLGRPALGLLPAQEYRSNDMNQLTPDEREVGQENFYAAMGALDQSPAAEHFKRRDFLKTVIGVGAAAGMTTGCKYFGYTPIRDPLRVAVIGTGDEGSVLIGAINPDYIKVVSICDIRPFNIHRALQVDGAAREAEKQSAHRWASAALQRAL